MDTLVLDHSFSPVARVSWERAITLLWEGKVEVLSPRAQGGTTRWENIVIACVPCNQKKGGRTPEQAKMRLLSVPVKPKKLPDTMRLTFTFQKGMPASWANWLRSVSYWNGELES
jgi:5-methylcytosine-specific restriction endonuclease McrA